MNKVIPFHRKSTQTNKPKTTQSDSRLQPDLPNPAILQEVIAFCSAEAHWRGRLATDSADDVVTRATENAHQDWRKWMDYAKIYVDAYWDALKDD